MRAGRRARGRRRIGRSGAHGGKRDAFYTYAEQIFFWRALPEIFFESCLLFFFF